MAGRRPWSGIAGQRAIGYMNPEYVKALGKGRTQEGSAPKAYEMPSGKKIPSEHDQSTGKLQGE